jgi:predicted AlkP superfamily pyrophosphatase or phosphodiesterase
MHDTEARKMALRRTMGLLLSVVFLCSLSLAADFGNGARRGPFGQRVRGTLQGGFRQMQPGMRPGGTFQNAPGRFGMQGMRPDLPAAPAKIDRTIIIVIDSMNNSFIFDRWRNPAMALTPNIRELVNNGAVYQNARAVLPAVTQINQLAIISGCYADRIGFAGNEVYRKEKIGPIKFDEPWKKPGYIKCDTMFKAIKREKPKLKTAVVAGKDYVGCPIEAYYNIAPSRISGSARKDIPGAKRFPEAGNWDAPDAWVMDNALKVVEKADPALLMIDLGFLDPVQHNFGAGSPQAWAAVEWADYQVGRLLQSLIESNKMDTTLIVLTADHGQNNYWQRISIKKMIEDAKIGVEFVQAGPLSHIFLKDKTQASAAANALRQSGLFDGVWAGAELNAEHLATPYTGDVVASARAPYDAIQFRGPLGMDIRSNMYGNHGGVAEQDVPIIFFGPGVRRGVMLGGTGRASMFGRFASFSALTASLADITPTIVSLTGLPLPKDVQGKVLPVAERFGMRPPTQLQLSLNYPKAGGRSLAVLLFIGLSVLALLGARRAAGEDKAPGILRGIFALVALSYASTAAIFALFARLYNSVPGIQPDAYFMARVPSLIGSPVISHPIIQMKFWGIVWVAGGALFALLSKLIAREKSPGARWLALPVSLAPLAASLLVLAAVAYTFPIPYWLARPAIGAFYLAGLAASVVKMSKDAEGDNAGSGKLIAAAAISVALGLVILELLLCTTVGSFILTQLTYYPVGTH